MADDRAHLKAADALARLAGHGAERSVELFRHGSLEAKLYAPRGYDPQTAHTRDEVYVIARGKGAFFDGRDWRPVEEGDLLFVAAGVEHRFEDFTEDFATWVLFYGPEGGEAGIVGPRH